MGVGVGVSSVHVSVVVGMMVAFSPPVGWTMVILGEEVTVMVASELLYMVVRTVVFGPTVLLESSGPPRLPPLKDKLAPPVGLTVTLDTVPVKLADTEIVPEATVLEEIDPPLRLPPVKEKLASLLKAVAVEFPATPV